MVRRFLCLGAVLLLLLLGVPACSDSKTQNEKKTVPDPDAGAQPKPAGKGG